MTTCSREGCKRRGSWIPVFVMRPPGDSTAEIRAPLPATMCGEHKRLLKLEDLLKDEDWELIVKEVFLANGLSPPERSRTTLAFEPA